MIDDDSRITIRIGGRNRDLLRIVAALSRERQITVLERLITAEYHRLRANGATELETDPEHMQNG